MLIRVLWERNGFYSVASSLRCLLNHRMLLSCFPGPCLRWRNSLLSRRLRWLWLSRATWLTFTRATSRSARRHFWQASASEHLLSGRTAGPQDQFRYERHAPRTPSRLTFFKLSHSIYIYGRKFIFHVLWMWYITRQHAVLSYMSVYVFIFFKLCFTFGTYLVHYIYFLYSFSYSSVPVWMSCE